MVSKYFIPKVGPDLRYSCMLETHKPNNERLFIPILIESHPLRAEQKSSKFESYKLIRGGPGNELRVVTLLKDTAAVQERVVKTYDDIFNDSTMTPIDKDNIHIIEAFFEQQSTRSIQIKTDFEGVIDCGDIYNVPSASQPQGDLKHPITPDKFLENSDLEITEFTMPFYGLSYAIFRSLHKLLNFINKNPDLKRLYEGFMETPLCKLFSTKSSDIAASASFDDHLRKSKDNLSVVKELLGVKSVFKGVVENVSKIHDKPEVRFVFFIQTLIIDMKDTLMYRGYTKDSSPHTFRLLHDLESEFNKIMDNYLQRDKSPGGCVSQAKLQQLINIAVTKFEELMRIMGNPIHQWSVLPSKYRQRSKLTIEMIAGNPQDSSTSSTSSLNLTEQKLLENRAAVLDAVGGEDIKGFTGKSDTKIVVGNGMKCDGSPPSYNTGEDAIDLLLNFELHAKITRDFHGIQVEAFPVTSNVTCIMDGKSDPRVCDTHTGDAERFAVLADPVYDTNKGFCDAFHKEKADIKNKIVCPCAAFYILANTIPENHHNPDFLAALDLFYNEADKTFNEGVDMRKILYPAYKRWIPDGKSMKFKKFVIINGLLYVLVSFIDTINGGISNNMTMYLICQCFSGAATFRGACSSMEDCRRLFEQTKFKVFEEKYFKEKGKGKGKVTRSETQVKDWSKILCQIGLNSKEIAGDQFKKFFCNIANILFNIKCLLGTGDLCLVYGLSGDGISLAVFRSMLSWLPHGTTELPQLSEETVQLIAKYQFLLMIYGSYKTDDTDDQKIAKITDILTKLSSLTVGDVAQKKTTFETLTQFSELCHIKLKTNIVECYKIPELEGLQKRLTILREKISPETNDPNVDIDSKFNYLRLLRIYLVYLTQYNKLLLDGPTVFTEGSNMPDIVNSNTRMLQQFKRFNDIVSNPMTGSKLSDNQKIQFNCSNEEGFIDLVVLPEELNHYEAVEELMAKASGEVNDCVALKALKSMVLNDQGLLELYKQAYQVKDQSQKPDEVNVSAYKESLARLAPITLNEFDIFELLKLKQVLLSSPEIILSGTGSRGVSLTESDIENSLHGAIARAFDIFIADLSPDNPKMAEEIKFIREDVVSKRMQFEEVECKASATHEDTGTTPSTVFSPGGSVAAAAASAVSATAPDVAQSAPSAAAAVAPAPSNPPPSDRPPPAAAGFINPNEETMRKRLKGPAPKPAQVADDTKSVMGKIPNATKIRIPPTAANTASKRPTPDAKYVQSTNQTVKKNKEDLTEPQKSSSNFVRSMQQQPARQAQSSSKFVQSFQKLPGQEESSPTPPSKSSNFARSTRQPAIQAESSSSKRPPSNFVQRIRQTTRQAQSSNILPSKSEQSMGLPPSEGEQPKHKFPGITKKLPPIATGRYKKGKGTGGNSRKLKNKQHNITKKYRTKTRKSRQTRRNKHKYKHTRTIKRRKSRRNNSN